MRKPPKPTHIQLSDERVEYLIKEIKVFFYSEFDDELSDFRAKNLLDFFIARLGPAVYNQAINDAHKYMEEKLSGLSGELYEPESR